MAGLFVVNLEKEGQTTSLAFLALDWFLPRWAMLAGG
jgi:hypothetical protein